MFIVICYAIHDKKIASVDSRDTYEDAIDFLETDAKNTYEEEIANGGENVELDVDETCIRNRNKKIFPDN